MKSPHDSTGHAPALSADPDSALRVPPAPEPASAARGSARPASGAPLGFWGAGLSTLAAAALAACGGGDDGGSGGGGLGGGGVGAPAPGVVGGGGTPEPAPGPGGTPSPGPAPSPGTPAPSPGTGGGTPSPGPAPSPGTPAPPPAGQWAAPANLKEAARFLAQATPGASKAEIQALANTTYAQWIEAQFAMAPTGLSYFNWQSKALDQEDIDKSSGGDHAQIGNMTRKLVESPDGLRQRMVHALAEIWVVFFTDGPGSGCYMDYLDRLEQNAFGNFRTLMERLFLTKAMGTSLTYVGNTKADLVKGSQPDENMAREIMQLFTIGLYQLNADGSLKGGREQPTYDVADVQGLAKVFTGWVENRDLLPGAYKRDTQKYDLVQDARRYETAEKRFLGVTVPTGTSAQDSLRIALDTLFNHDNVGPFIGKQLIQRLVTSNPSAGYIGRVSAAFANNGAGVRGDLKAVVRAVLLDPEARNPANASSPTFGKLREPMFRYTNWLRAWKTTSRSGWWKDMPGYSSAPTKLNQGPLQSPSVFNFFSPGYVPPTSAIADQHMVAPEFQITTEISVAAFVNFMQERINLALIEHNNVDYRVDHSPLIALATEASSQKLVDEVNLVIAAGQIPDATAAAMATAIDTISNKDLAGQRNRVQAALTLVFASPEYVVQK